jgi:hypothetical protein
MNRLLLSLVLVLSSSALAEEPAIFTWSDPDGTVHYSNEHDKVPKDATTTKGEELTVIEREKPAAAVADTKADKKRRDLEDRRAEAETRKAEAEAARAEAALEQHWRQQFRDAHAKIEKLSDELERARAKITDPSGLPISGRYFTATSCPLKHNHRALGSPCQYGVPDESFESAKLRVEQLERQLQKAQEDLQELDRRASFASIPREWRR